jgi:hypothetical protein
MVAIRLKSDKNNMCPLLIYKGEHFCSKSEENSLFLIDLSYRASSNSSLNLFDDLKVAKGGDKSLSFAIFLKI